MPRLSIVIPTHSRPHFLPEAVESAKQAASDVEVIVVDDSSTDATRSVCQTLSGIKYIRLDPNRHTAGARNAGIAISQAEFLHFHDDDDLLLPGQLEHLLDVLDRNPTAAFAYGQVSISNARTLDKTNQLSPQSPRSGDIFWDVIKWNFIPILAAVVRKRPLIEIGCFDITLPGADWDLWVRLSENYLTVGIARLCGIYRDPTPLSGQDSSKPVSIVEQILKGLEKWARLPRVKRATQAEWRSARQALLNRLSDVLIYNAIDSLNCGLFPKARSELLYAIKIQPYRSIRPQTLRLLLRTLFHSTSSRGSASDIPASSVNV